MADPFEEYELLEVFTTLVVLADLLRLTDSQLAAVGVPERGRERLARARGRLRTEAALAQLKKNPRGLVYLLADAFEFEKKLLPAFQRGGQRALIAALLEGGDQRMS